MGNTMRSLCLAILALMIAGNGNAADTADFFQKCMPETVDGSARLDLSKVSTPYIYVDFWASWCGPCRESFPFLNRLKARFAGKGITVVGVNVDQDVGDAKDFLKQHPAAFVVARDADGRCAKAMGVTGMPSSFVLDKHGAILYRHRGFRSSDKSKITQELEKIQQATVAENGVDR